MGKRVRVDIAVDGPVRDSATVDVHGYNDASTAVRALMQCATPSVIADVVRELRENGELTPEAADEHLRAAGAAASGRGDTA